MKIKMRKIPRRNRWYIQIGGVNGESFMVLLQLFGIKPRLTICFNTDRLIRLFGFNQKVIGF